MEKLSELYDSLHEAEMNLSMIEDEYGDYEDEVGVPKYERYSLKGGENYQEILYTLPGIEKNKKGQYEIKNKSISKFSEYTSPHWSEKNVLAHVRLKDFEDITGNKVLFIDEIQSDLHQQGRKEGYSTPESRQLEQELKEKVDKLSSKEIKIMEKQQAIRRQLISMRPEKVYEQLLPKVENKSNEEIKELLSPDLQQKIEDFDLEPIQVYMSTEAQKIWLKNPEYAELQNKYDKLEKQYKKVSSENLKLKAEYEDVAKENRDGIADAFPFKKNWHEFVLRRMINNAVEQGYDEVAWTTGRQQRERYNLSKTIDYIEYQKLYNHPKDVDIGKVGTVEIVAYKNGSKVFDRQIEAEKLDDYIGKDLSSRILTSKEGKGTITNLDEEIRENGNSGMYLFYDQEIPNYLNKYLKKWNSKVEEITLKDADGKEESKQMGFKITDEMRNSIKQNGQPLFSNRQLDDTENSTYDEKIQQRNKEVIKELRNKNENINFTKRTANNDNTQRNAERQGAYIEEEIQRIEKYGKWDDSIPVTKLSDIRKTIEDYLGLGIKKGHFRQSAYALYKGNRDVIRTREYKDMDSILHETGHALDLGNRLKVDKESISNELLRAIDKLGGYEEESRKVRLDEGFAEVIREYSIVPERAKNEYPQTIAVIEKIRQNDKSFDNFIGKVQQQTYNYIHQNPRNRTLSNLSIGEQTDRTPLTKNWIKQEFMRKVYDKDYALKSAVSTMQKVNGKTMNQLKASENAYLLTRLSSGITDKVTSMLSDGYIDTKGNKVMPGLNQIGEILGNNPERFNDLRAYLVARRDMDYRAKTLKTGLRNTDSQAVINQFKNDKQIQQAAKLVYDTLDGVMQYAVNNGLISQDSADSLKESNAFYVPMQRVLENRGNQVGRKGAVVDFLKKRTGSELDIKDVLENIVANSSNIIQQVENNNILRALYNQGEEAGLTGSIYDVIDAPMTKVGTAKLSTWESELQRQGVNTTDLDLEKTVDLFAPSNKVNYQEMITSFINEKGKRVYLQFNDEILFNSLMGLDKNSLSYLLKLSSYANMPLRYGATMANVGFAIPNMISDTTQAAIFSDAGFIPVVDNALGVLDILAATNKSVRNFVNQVAPGYADKINELYTIYQQTGATSSTRLSQYRKSAQSTMKDIYGTKNSKNLGIDEKWKPLKRLLDLMTYIPEISEQSTRFEVFKKNYNQYKLKGNSETDARIQAAMQSRDATQDFGRAGTLTREINQLIPFSAARVGSAYTFTEKITANPKQVGMRIAVLTAIAMAIKGMGYDDDEIQELNQRKKDDNFVLKVGNSVVTIKKPQGILRSMVNLAEYIQDLATGHIEEGKEGERLTSWIKNALADNLPADEWGGYVPNSVAPVLENWINRDFYYNTDIVKSYDLELPDAEQYYDYNSQLAIWLGKMFNYSPAKIDNLISGYFAGLGTQLTNIMDYGLGKLGVTAEKPEMGAESDAVGKRFIVNVNSNSSSIDEIYDRKTELTKLKNGGTISEEETQELEKISSALSNISNLNKQIKAIKKDLTMSGKEKAEQIKILQQEKTDTARKALNKNVIHSENESKIQSTQFFPSRDTLTQSGYTLSLNSDQKKEYENIANEYYNKYSKQGIYSEEKLQDIKSKAKEYAKKQLMQKYKSDLVKTKK